MQHNDLILFAATVLPLVCTPGPDILFVASQSLTGGRSSAARATTGVILGYAAHAALGALGVAAVVATSPRLFELLRWVGIAYLAYLAVQMFRSAMRPRGRDLEPAAQRASLLKGFLTSFLNPKGLLVYFTILPNFMHPGAGGEVATQALALSAVFIGLCTVIYGVVGLAIAAMPHSGVHNDRSRRLGEAFAGGMLVFAAVKMGSR